MAAEIQYYDWKFTKDEWNLIYQNIINCDIVKPPFFNNSFRTKFVQWSTEQWDKANYFLRKRKWFKRISFYNWNSTETELIKETNNEWLNWIFTDMVVIDWYRYFILINDKKNKLRIYKQIDTNDYSECSNSCYNDIDEWHIVNISLYNWKDYFPFNSCCNKKFVVTTYVKWDVISEWTDWVAITKRNYNNFTSFLYKENWERIVTEPWDFILTYWENAAWLVHVVWKNNDTVWDHKVTSLATTREPVIKLESEINTINNVSYKVFKKYWQTFHFITSDWIVHRHYDEWKPSTFKYTFAWNTYRDTQDNTTKPNFYIQSFTELDQWVCFLADNWFLFLSWQGFNKFLYSWTKIVQTNWLYTDIYEYMWQLVLTWDDRLWYFAYDYNTWATQLMDLTKNNWQFSRGSIWIFDDKFFLVRKTKDLYTMQIQFWYWSTKPAVIFQYLNNFLNTDLEMLDHSYNNINISFIEWNIFLAINDWTWNTKILYYNRYYNVWSKWLVTWCEIHSVHDWVFLWKWIFKNEWTTDDWNDITQIVTMTFWDQTQSVNKLIEYIKLPIWYNSYFEKWQSYVTSYVDMWWRHYWTTYNDFGRTDYATNVMKVQLSNDTISNYLWTIKNYPIWIEISAAKWVNFEKDVVNTYTEFQEYLNYTQDWSTWDEESNFTISKFAPIKIPLSQMWEIFTFEIVAKWKADIEFWWFFIAFSYMDNDFDRLENTLTVGWLTSDSWKTFYTPPTYNVT